jgi:predicted Zn-dependent peptidase
MGSMYRKIIFDNGLRLVAERMPKVKSVVLGIWVNVGSRDEGKGEEGMSHFLEHMFFKGTASRTAADLSREIDALGGEMNAFTSRETTTFYVKVLDQHVNKALTLLADLFHHSVFETGDVEKEKQVVLEEVRMVRDDPEDFVQDLHMRHVLKRHPLGRSILGKTAVIRQLRRGDLFRYVEAHYHPLETVIAVAGNFDAKELVPRLERLFGSFTRSARPTLNRWPAEVNGGLAVRQKRLEQVHLSVGLKGVRLDHKDRWATYALNAVLGGSVSSRLFQEIREKRGLAYSIYSYTSSFSDTGTLAVYAATRPQEAPRVLELVNRQIRRLRNSGVTAVELQRIKQQMKGNLLLSLEGTHSRMYKLAKDELFHGRHIPLEEMMSDIDKVSREQLLRAATELFDPAVLSVAALGPVSLPELQMALQV